MMTFLQVIKIKSYLYKKIMRCSFLILTILFSANLFSQQNPENFYAVVNSDTAIIWHENASRNCCVEHRLDFDIFEKQINIYEVEVTEHCYCGYCYYNLSLTLIRLLPGHYNVNYYWVGYYNNDTTYCGETSFSVLKGKDSPQKIAQYQSECIENPIKEKKEKEIIIYPNPLTKKQILHIESDEKVIEYSISSFNGYYFKGQLINNSIDLDFLSPGVYILQLKTESAVIRKMFVLDK